LVQIVDADNVNHIVVYMTGEMPFPEGYSGAGNYLIQLINF
jgi:hypothetical protein